MVIAIIFAGWFWYSQSPQVPLALQQETPTGNSTGSNYVPDNLLLGTDATSTLGTYLIASNGMTLYRYTKDGPNVSNCTDTCAKNWPPYIIASTDVLANVQAGIPGKVGFITRADGAMQVTYNSQPLYFWKNDKQSGDTTGQNVGGVWFVVTP